jgi:hypothetical protein
MTPLTRIQHATVLALVEARRLEPVRSGPGQHEALGRYLRAIFDNPPADKAAREFDRLRRARNQDRYEAKPVGAAATEKAEQVARTLFDAAVSRGISPWPTGSAS